MREIKFRAWDRKNKKMVEVRQIDWNDEGEIEYINRCNDLLNFLLLQYTGLKDKNRKEIYEGDIIYCSEGAFVPVYDSYLTKYVGWFYYEDTLELDWDSFEELYADGEDIEVVGNIYQNRDLLPNKVIDKLIKKLEVEN